jgi:hypothetical protein
MCRQESGMRVRLNGIRQTPNCSWKEFHFIINKTKSHLKGFKKEWYNLVYTLRNIPGCGRIVENTRGRSQEDSQHLEFRNGVYEARYGGTHL